MSTDIRTISHIERKLSSVYGNPRFRVHFTDGTWLFTQPDAGIAYGIENPEYQGRPLLIETARGQIVYVRNPDGSVIL